MALPPRTDEQRNAALASANAARRARAAIKDRLKRGERTLAQVLTDAATDDVIGRTRILEIVRALPQIGTVTAHQIMTELQITPTQRLRSLTDRQRDALLTMFDGIG